MVYFSFGNLAFNLASGENTINMAIAAKTKYVSPEQFLADAITFMDEEVDPGYGIKEEYAGALLKDGQYVDIVKKWIDSMNEKVEICFDRIHRTWRIKKNHPDLISDEFVLETEDEYILFLWTTSA